MITFKKIWSAAWPYVKTVLILVVGYFAVKLLINLINKGLGRSKLDISLARFITKTVKIVLYFVIIILALNSIGISTTEIVTMLSLAAAALTVVLKDSISNVMGGILLLVSPRFSTGDYISVGSEEGTVISVDLLHTTVVSYDKRQISIPNNVLINSNITNYTREKSRRVDLDFPISYEANIDTAKKSALDAIKENKLVFADPEPFVRVKSYGDSSVNLTVRVWCKTEDYWTVYFDLTERIRESFNKNGVKIPYNQLDVHIGEK